MNSTPSGTPCEYLLGANAPSVARAPTGLVIATCLLWFFPFICIAAFLLFPSLFGAIALMTVISIPLLCLGLWAYWAMKVLQQPTRMEWLLLGIVPAIGHVALSYAWITFFWGES